MSEFGSTDAVRKTITVRCSADTAFRIWTEQINAWWPKGHSRSGHPSTTVLIEGQAGGRIYERTPEGVEYDWGQIVVWDPPHHFAYYWYLGSDSQKPTRVDVQFIAQGKASTRVDVNHRGPEFIGDLWPRNSSKYDAAWESLIPAYVAACDASE